MLTFCASSSLRRSSFQKQRANFWRKHSSDQTNPNTMSFFFPSSWAVNANQSAWISRWRNAEREQPYVLLFHQQWINRQGWGNLPKSLLVQESILSTHRVARETAVTVGSSNNWQTLLNWSNNWDVATNDLEVYLWVPAESAVAVWNHAIYQCCTIRYKSSTEEQSHRHN